MQHRSRRIAKSEPLALASGSSSELNSYCPFTSRRLDQKPTGNIEFFSDFIGREVRKVAAGNATGFALA